MNRNTTIVLAVVFVVVLGVTLFARRAQENAPATSTPVSTTGAGQLWTVTAEQIVGVWLVDLTNNRAVALAKSDQGTWSVTAPDARQADQVQAETAASRFTGLYASTTITTATDLTAFGVLSPTYAFGVELADGTQLKAAVGEKTPMGTSYYVLRDGDANVVVVDGFSIDNLVALLDAPPYYVPTPTPTATAEVSGTPTPSATP
jgi:hypothetical protein